MRRKPEAFCTTVLIVINVAVFLILSMLGDTEDAAFMLQHGAMYEPFITEGLGERQIALFRFGERVYALDNREPGSTANVLSRGLLGDVGGEPVVISPLYKQRIRLRDGWPCDGSEQAVRAWPVKVENGKVWVGNQQLLARAEASHRHTCKIAGGG